MLPGRTFRPEDLLKILLRRFWIIAVPFSVVSAATAVHVRYLPDVYRSDALISVKPPRVPESIVPSAMPVSLEERLPAIRNEIMSRVRLERIIQDLNLYPAERRIAIMEDIVERMRGEIIVQPVAGNAIRVGFQAGDPRTAQRVAERVAALFIDESSRDRNILIEGTDQFLATSLEEARQRLLAKEAALAQYRMKHGDELPTQLQANLQAAQNLQTRIQTTTTAIDRDAERRLILERQLAELESQVPTPEMAAAVAPGQAPTTDQQLRAARTQLVEMEVTKKPDHPDVQRMKRIIRDLQAKLEKESLEAPVSAGGGRVVSAAEATRLRRIEEVRAQIDQIDKQTARNREDIEKLRVAAGEYQRRAEAAPVRETEMVELMRDYNTLNQLYTGLLSKREASNLTASLERRQIGEQFQLLDPARVPGRPFSPDRQRMNLMGMAVGLGIGLVIVGLLEYFDSTLKTDDDVARVLGVSVLAVVPLMQTDQERRRTFRRRVLVGGALGSTVVGCLAVLAYTFIR
jgi:polysaccharide chain length determinant protein (PEP-CTERM system associated)